MKRISRSTLLLLCCFFGASIAFPAGFNKAGRTSFQFLKIGIGAQQTALGEATIAYIRDVNTAFWNPAGISGIQSTEASFSYARWFADMTYIAGAAGIRWRDVGVFAIGYSSLGYGAIPEAFATGSSSDTRTGSTFTGSDMMLSASFAHEFSEALSIGVTAKYVQEKLYTYSTSLVAFDVGTYYDTGLKGIRFAMSFQNFGKSVKFLSMSDREEGYDIPLVYRVGTSVNIIDGENGFINAGPDHRFVFCFESVNSNDYGERWHIGGEYAFQKFLFLRGGYRFNYDEGNLSLGIGLRQKVADKDLRLDYAYVSYQYLESPHRITLSVGF